MLGLGWLFVFVEFGALMIWVCCVCSGLVLEVGCYELFCIFCLFYRYLVGLLVIAFLLCLLGFVAICLLSGFVLIWGLLVILYC